MATVATCGHENSMSNKCRLFVYDKHTNQRYLIDSGSDLSIIPKPKFNFNTKPSKLELFAANDSKIKTYGQQIMKLEFNLRRSFTWNFVVADVGQAIIGSDFLNHFGLIIDIKNQRLIDPITKLSTKGERFDCTHIEIKTVSSLNSNEFSDILKEFPELSRPRPFNESIKHNTVHYIETTGQPVYARARKLNPKQSEIAKQEFQYMLDQGIIAPSKSNWSSPLHMVPKK